MSTRLGGEDWVSRWQAMYTAAEAAHRGTDEPDRWRHRAARFDRITRARSGTDVTVDALGAYVHPADVVIDVGAGTGRHAVPLAARCARVIAVEPSAAMRDQLAARVAQADVINVDVVPDAWPAARCPVADVVYSSHVLYGVCDVAAFLDAMTRAARRRCVLLLGLRAPSSGLDALWAAVRGAPRPPRPAALEALAVLHQLGQPADLHVLPGSGRRLSYAEEPEDLDELCRRLGVDPDEPGRARVRAALVERYPRDENNRFLLDDTGLHALIDWPAEPRA
jgi:SAM-dependent methyltransferase